MPEPYWPKRKSAFTLLDAHRVGSFLRIACRYCKQAHVYRADDLKTVLGNIEVDDVPYQMRCVRCAKRHTLDLDMINPSAAERQMTTIRRVDRIDYVRRVTWRDVVGG